ncbi:PREDICTED: uncharacterized protein LOC106102075, partial [Papilio polytes]|uniref:uncharacterized protein LOC106102075 n=1 Tax=Papilio polytes TaxID=76194 RepID=UPI0006763FC5
LIILHQTYGIIYELNETEYIKMPPVFHLDPYEPCIHRDGGKYCTIDIDIIADEESELLNMMKEYSKRTERHFNHTRLQYGLCISDICKEYLNNTKEFKLNLEKCLNDSFTRNYKLKTKLNGDIICNKEDKYNLEPMYQNVINHGLFDGTLLVQTFFITSGCLLAYHMQIFSEKQNITWIMIPKAILMRWLRLTPSYAVILAVVMTWARFAGSGPLWEKIVYPEVYGCRAEGWRNLVYINNYIDNSQCMTQTWYIAADMQLFVLGIFILVLAKSPRVKKVVISLLFVISLFILPLHTYFQDLRAHLIITPETSDIYRPIVEWQGWEVPARVSYAAYLLHLILIQIVTGLRTTLTHISIPQIILVSFGSFFISFLVAYPFWLLVEAPIAQLIKLVTSSDETDRKIDGEKRNSLI